MNDNEFSDGEYEYPDREPTQTWIYQMHQKWYTPLSIKKDGKSICVRKVEKGKAYKKCKTELLKCCRCYNNICPNKECIPQYMVRNPSYTTPAKIHDKCIDCENITCCPSGICSDCEKLHTYDMITDTVAIGSYQASYDPFDLVINLDYPENNVKFGEVVCEKKEDAYVIKCGYNDIKGGGLTSDTLKDLLNRIDDYKKESQKYPKILFHCYAGVSRSATVAIAYLAKSENKTTNEMYTLAKEKRPRINPNESFKKILNLVEKQDILD
jgi:hypothetical protein